MKRILPRAPNVCHAKSTQDYQQAKKRARIQSSNKVKVKVSDKYRETNRLSAERSRKRNKLLKHNLETSNDGLRQQNFDLNSRIKGNREHIVLLRREIAELVRTNKADLRLFLEKINEPCSESRNSHIRATRLSTGRANVSSQPRPMPSSQQQNTNATIRPFCQNPGIRKTSSGSPVADVRDPGGRARPVHMPRSTPWTMQSPPAWGTQQVLVSQPPRTLRQSVAGFFQQGYGVLAAVASAAKAEPVISLRERSYPLRFTPRAAPKPIAPRVSSPDWTMWLRSMWRAAGQPP